MEQMIQPSRHSIQMVDCENCNHVKDEVDDGCQDHRRKKPVLNGIFSLRKEVNRPQEQHNAKASRLSSD